MSLNPSKTLEILFAMDQDTINRDLRRAEEDFHPVSGEIASILAFPVEVVTPEMEARLAHLWLVEAYDFCRRDAVAPEVKTFIAASGAELVTDNAKLVVAQKDTLGKLASRMLAICRREGVADAKSWILRNEGPPDFRELEAEFGRVLTRAADTVVAFTLCRYHMDEQADLFERDPDEFDIQREIGRRVVSSSRKDNLEKFMDDSFRRRYGENTLQRVHSRAKELCAKQASLRLRQTRL